jgi:hypothetical protein
LRPSHRLRLAAAVKARAATAALNKWPVRYISTRPMPPRLVRPDAQAIKAQAVAPRAAL